MLKSYLGLQQDALDTMGKERQRLRDQFQRDAMEALREAEATGLGHDLADVEAYFAQMAEFRAGRAPRPAPLEPKPLAR